MYIYSVCFYLSLLTAAQSHMLYMYTIYTYYCRIFPLTKRIISFHQTFLEERLSKNTFLSYNTLLHEDLCFLGCEVLHSGESQLRF
jgi:hypothetical protein